MMVRLLPVFLFFISQGLSAQVTDFTGIVYLDQNANGKKDPSEMGLAGVSVSDQVTVVQTDGSGNFRLPSANEFPYIFISLPSGYSGAYYLPKTARLEFGIRKDVANQGFRFIHASDPHMDSLNLPRMQRFREMADSLEVNFVIITGDLVRDALRVTQETAGAYYELYLSEIKKFSMPVYSAVGNHELFGIERDKSLVPANHPLYGKKMYRHYLGPNYYSFNHGGVHFVAIDGVQYQNLFYFGGVDSLQLAWLARDLDDLPASTPVVTFNHIPFVSAGFSFLDFENDPFYGPQLLMQDGLMKHRHVVHNFDEVLAIIGQQPYPLALSGHFHMAQEARFEGTETRFAQTAAITRPESFDYYGLPGHSGFTLYEMADGKVRSSQFIPLRLTDP